MVQQPPLARRIPGLLVALLPLILGPRPAAVAAPGESGAPTVVARPLGGDAVTGRLVRLDLEAATLITAEGERTLALGRLLGLAPESPAPGRLAWKPTLRATLRGGERIVGRFAGPADDGLVIETPDLGTLTLGFDTLQSLAPLPPDAGSCFEPEALHPRAAEGDVAYVRSGDAHPGLLLAVDAEGVRLEGEQGEERVVPWKDLVVLQVGNEPLDRPSGLRVEVESVGGSRVVTATSLGFAEGVISLALLSDPRVEVRIPLAALRTLETDGGDFVHACDLPFGSEFRTPYEEAEGDGVIARFLRTWFGARADRRPGGCPLRIEGRRYAHGFAAHAFSRITLDLDGKYTRFETLFGVDDVALERPVGGVLSARVLIDGTERWKAETVRAGEPPKAVGPLDVTGAKTLVLEVGFGPDGLHVRDYATWAEPILVR